MPRKDIEGGWVMGWPDRKRYRLSPSKDQEGRTIMGRAPLLRQEGLITPTDAFYVWAQLHMPDPVHPDDYSFEIFGEVEKAATYGIEDLRKLPGHSVRAVTECAGNDSGFWDYLESRAKGVKATKPSMVASDEVEGVNLRGLADKGEVDIAALNAAMPSTCLVSGGEWTGVRLREILSRAKLKSSAVAVRFEGFDSGRPDPIFQYRSTRRTDFKIHDPGVINYDKGLPIEKAMDPDTILAWAHNGEWLTHVHGAPLRLVVPGWAGNWWVKWIHKIEVMDRMPDCYHQTHYFVSGKGPDDPDKKPMMALGVKTLITEPRDEDSPLPRGSHAIRGLAWSGEGAMTRVEVSTDNGQSWHDAHIEQHGDRYLWRRFSYLWEVDRLGQYILMCRGIDEKNRRQPVTEWNFQRKHFDGIVPIFVTIE